MTDTPIARLQTLLLDFLSTRRRVDQSTVAGLTERDWETLLGMARRHRVIPLLHWRLEHEQAGVHTPQAVREALAGAFRRSTLQALRMQRELLLIHRVLESVDIPHIALKGAYLAFYAYPHPALRPMRDLDILVPKEMTLQAYRTLLDAGFVRTGKLQGELEAVLESRNHLPPLISAAGRVLVDVHSRLSTPCPDKEVPDLTDEDALWGRTIDRTAAGNSLSFLCPEDLLLHLVEHAVYHHRLDNGPLVLTDLAYVLEKHAIEWPSFWQRTQRHNQTRGTLLLLAMVEFYFGKQPVQWPDAVSIDSVPQGVVETAANLLIQRDVRTGKDVGLANDVMSHPSVSGKIAVFIKRAFPSRREMALLYPAPENSLRLYLCYFSRWHYLLTVRLPEYLASRTKNEDAGEVRGLIQLEQWLQKN